MRRIRMICGLFLAGIGCLPVLCAQDVELTSHAFRQEANCPEPQRIVVKLPPPRVEVKDDCCQDDSSRRRCLLLQRHRSDGPRSEARYGAPVEGVFWAPASLPTVVTAAPAAAVVSHTQQITHDFSSLRHAQEIEIHAAGVAAHLAARNAMINAENDALHRILERTQKRIESVCTTVDAGTPPGVVTDKGDGKQVSLDVALKNLNARLDRLEDLVLLHQKAIESLKQKNP